MKCKSGKHEWDNPLNAARCCDPAWKRVVVPLDQERRLDLNGKIKVEGEDMIHGWVTQQQGGSLPAASVFPDKPTTYLASLPFFPGFYESSLDAMIDRAIEYEMEGNPPDRPSKTWEEVEKIANFSAARIAMAQEWVATFSRESKLAMEWESMQSPREYNVTTDRVFARLPEETMRKLVKVKDSPEFLAIVKKMFTSYDGFISFYPNSPDQGDWLKEVREWDHNQLQALLATYIVKEVDDDPAHFRGVIECNMDESAVDHLWDSKV